jgi:mRNA interferase MazF
MVAPTRGSVALVPFPFSDLSQAKLRPAVVLADAGKGDWILCQVTSRPYGDDRAIPIDEPDFQSGGLRMTSYARPGKLFTAHATLLQAEAGQLNAAAFARVRAGVLDVLG